MKAFTWTVSPDDSGEYFCIGVNYQSRESEIKHYKQEFKLFGQGPYKYHSTTKVWTPTEKYLAKNYKYFTYVEFGELIYLIDSDMPKRRR